MIVTGIYGPMLPAEMIAAGLGDIVWSTATQAGIAASASDDQLAAFQAVLKAHDPSKQPPTVTTIPVLDLYRRMTDAEYAAMQAGVAAQSPRVQGIFARADNFRSDAPEWSLLVTMARKLYGDTRAADLLNLPPFNGEA